MSDLSSKKCRPCEGLVAPLQPTEYEPLLTSIAGWDLKEQKLIEKEFHFRNFKEALAFINQVGEIAEKEGHHPDILLYSYKHVRVSLMTHAVQGLSENDFIVAAKIDAIM